MARELAAHGAPRRLVHAARRARLEELRHARATARLARRFGAEPVRPRVGPSPTRTLFEVARDNATEGCVRETFGAVTAPVQAATARDAEVRRAMRSIAGEEASHAALSWAIDAWMQGRLSARDRRALASARDESVETLRREATEEAPRAIVTAAGMPTAEMKTRLLRRMDALFGRA